MHGSPRSLWITGGVLLLLLPATGCGPSPSEPPVPAEEVLPDAATAFEPANTATLLGQVTWDGTLPAVGPFVLRGGLPPDEDRRYLRQENPNGPDIDPGTKAVRNAVVFLRGVDRRRAKPWDHPPVRIDQRDYQFHVLQGESDSRVGFVRCGDPVEMVSSQPSFHSLHAGGAAFFTLTFPDPDRPRSRHLDRKGVVELTSGAGYYWMRAYLFVNEHPYYARTDAQGRFTLRQVPAGRYDVICWLPDWHEARHERDPETGLVKRLIFRPAVEISQGVDLGRGEMRSVLFALNGDLFGR